MKNCLILGAARSGTSLTAGCLANSGYFMGKNMMAPREGNPRGFFEDHHINSINDRILLTTQAGLPGKLPGGPTLAGKWFGHHHKWLLELSPKKTIKGTEKQKQEIRNVLTQEPWCFKDPRFCYTLPFWRPFIGDAVFVCVFRHPVECAESIVRESQTQDQTRAMNIEKGDGLNIYKAMYERVIGEAEKGEWLFLHFHQMINGDGVEKLSQFLNAKADESFADPSLYRNRTSEPVPENLKTLYQNLCQRAGYEDE